jgi:hypothetical protein
MLESKVPYIIHGDDDVEASVSTINVVVMRDATKMFVLFGSLDFVKRFRRSANEQRSANLRHRDVIFYRRDLETSTPAFD